MRALQKDLTRCEYLTCKKQTRRKRINIPEAVSCSAVIACSESVSCNTLSVQLVFSNQAVNNIWIITKVLVK